MFAKDTEYRIKANIHDEYACMKEKYGPEYHTPHEFYGVIKEEVEEMMEAAKNVEAYLDKMWEYIKADHDVTSAMLDTVSTQAIDTAMEACQVAAVLYKMKLSIQKKEEK